MGLLHALANVSAQPLSERVFCNMDHSQTSRSSRRAPSRSSLSNAEVSKSGTQGALSVIAHLELIDLTPEERAKALETTPLFASIHAAAASGGQTSVPTNLDTDLHFTCFVKAPSPPREEGVVSTKPARLLELDGRRAGPVDRGECEDLLKVCMLSGTVRYIDD